MLHRLLRMIQKYTCTFEIRKPFLRLRMSIFKSVFVFYISSSEEELTESQFLMITKML